MSKMVTLSDDPTIEILDPKKYDKLGDALDALYNLEYYDFLMYRGRIIQNIAGLLVQGRTAKWEMEKVSPRLRCSLCCGQFPMRQGITKLESHGKNSEATAVQMNFCVW